MATQSVSPHTSLGIFAAVPLKGALVRNYAGQDLGKLDDFVLDFDSGRIAYVTVSVGGFLGVGDKLFVIPWEFCSLRADEHTLYADVEKQLLLDSPSIDHGHWPNMGDPGWAERIHSHYAQKPYWNSDITDSGDYVGNNLLDNPDRDRV